MKSAEFCGPQNASCVNFELLVGRASRSGDRLRIELRWRRGLAAAMLGVRLRELLGARGASCSSAWRRLLWWVRA